MSPIIYIYIYIYILLGSYFEFVRTFHLIQRFKTFFPYFTLVDPDNHSRFGLVWFRLVLWHINHGRLFNAKSCLNIYNSYICVVVFR